MTSAGERAAAAEVLAKAKARTSRVRLLLDGDLEDRIDDARAAFDAAPDGDEKAALAARLVALEEEGAKAETEFVFQVSRGRWRKLIADHPPTDEQRSAGAMFNEESFVPAALSEFLVSPKLTVDDIEALNEDALDEAKFQTLWATLFKAAVGSGSRPPSEAARSLLNTRGNSKPASNSESAEASS